MTIVNLPHGGFRSGAISKDSFGDLNAPFLPLSAQEIVNFNITKTGALIKRPGIKYMTTIENYVRIEAFQKQVTEYYVLAFAPSTIRIMDSNGLTIIDLAAPYLTENDINELQVAQHLQDFVIVHESYPPCVIREKDGVFVLEYIDFTMGPTLDENVNVNITLKSSNYLLNEVTTLTASQALFVPEMVGGIWGITDPAGNLGSFRLWQPSTAYATGQYVRNSAGALYKAVAGGTSGNIEPTHYRDGISMTDGGVVWLFLNFSTGYVKITAVNTDLSATGTIQRALSPNCLAIGTTFWNEGAWSAWRGYPKTMCFYQNKAIFGGQKTTTIEYHPDEKMFGGNSFFGSKDGEFSNFDTGLGESTDSFAYSLSADKIDQILWISSGDLLFIGASSGIFPFKNLKTDLVFASRNIYEQVSRSVMPTNNNGLLWYTNFSDNVISAAKFSYESDAVVSSDIGILNRKITKGVKKMLSSSSTGNKIFLLRNDGTITIITYDEQYKISNMCQMSTPTDPIKNATMIKTDGMEWVVVLAGNMLGKCPITEETWECYTDFYLKTNSTELSIFNTKSVYFSQFYPKNVPFGLKFIQRFSTLTPEIGDFVGIPYTASVTIHPAVMIGNGQAFGFNSTAHIKALHVHTYESQELFLSSQNNPELIPIQVRDGLAPMDEPVMPVSMLIEAQAPSNSFNNCLKFSSVNPVRSGIISYVSVLEV